MLHLATLNLDEGTQDNIVRSAFVRQGKARVRDETREGDVLLMTVVLTCLRYHKEGQWEVYLDKVATAEERCLHSGVDLAG